LFAGYSDAMSNDRPIKRRDADRALGIVTVLSGVTSGWSDPGRRRLALGGVVGPVGFVGGWLAAGTATSIDYSPVHDAISRLAAVGSDTRVLMSAGFVAFGIGLPVYASALRRCVPGPAWITATMTGLATLGVAVTPLDRSSAFDAVHAACAAFGYLTLAATPILAARPLMQLGHTGLSRLGLGVGAVASVSLALSATALPTGLFQRLGLTAGDVWIVATAVAMAGGRLPMQPTQPPTGS